MDKTFFFMAGLPRSGSTLLSAILNQHPDIYSSPQTDLLQMMYLLDKKIPEFESYAAGINRNGYENVVKQLGQIFYSENPKPIIIDKNRAWGTPYNQNLALLLNPQVKIILPYRPILEILTSFVLLARKNPKSNFIDQNMEDFDFYARVYRNIDDARCDWLMRPNGEIDQAILSLAQCKDYPHKFCLINYHNLIHQPQETMASIYSFLNVTEFRHNFTRINHKENTDLDKKVFGMPELHQIRSNLKITSKDPNEILSSYVLKKYADVLDFL